MTSIVPLTGGNLPAYLKNRTTRADINKDVAVGAQYPTLSIKGKVFTLVKDNERKVLTRPDDPDEVLQNINLAVLRANTKARIFYAKAYTEGESDGARPTCYSNDSVAPAANSVERQANKCALCPHAVWGTGNNGEGTACTVNTRLAVADPDKLDQPILLRVPAGSRKNFAETVKAADSRGIPYNALVLKVGFDKEAPSPKLTFKIVGLLDDQSYGKVNEEMYDSDIVKEIVGLNSVPTPLPASDPVGVEELDAAIAAKAVVTRAAAPAPRAAKVKPAVAEDDIDAPKAAAPAPAPAPRAEPPAAPAMPMDDLLQGLDALLGQPDD